MTWPSVSIIIPVYNAMKWLQALCESIDKIKYPGSFEVFFVDNGSTDGSMSYLEKLGFNVLKYTETQSSYAARNMGIQASSGSVLAFTDSDCIIDSKWVENAILSLNNKHADMIAGRVRFYFSNSQDSWEIYDSLTAMDNEVYASNNSSATANLVVKRELFAKYGLFDDSAVSGEDVRWTQNACKNGAVIKYDPSALIKHPTRNKKEVIKKAKRLGKGLVHKIFYDNPSILLRIKKLLSTAIVYLMPPKINRTMRKARKLKYQITFRKMLFISWHFRLIRLIFAFKYIFIGK
jgi:glycosyltransferase involved in cell wall biosynthesis